jgi:polyisoprenoid-binding protein YceI
MTGTTLDGAWTIDPTHSRIGFSSRHAMVSRVRGAFNAVAGRAVIDTADFSRSTVSVQVELASIDTRNAFDSTQVEEVDDDSFIVSGDLSIRGITRPLSVPLSFVGIEHDPMGSTRAGFEGARRIDRRDWGIEWNTPLDSGGLLVSDKITLEFELSLVKETPPAAPTEAPPTAG